MQNFLSLILQFFSTERHSGVALRRVGRACDSVLVLECKHKAHCPPPPFPPSSRPSLKLGRNDTPCPNVRHPAQCRSWDAQCWTQFPTVPCCPLLMERTLLFHMFFHVVHFSFVYAISEHSYSIAIFFHLHSPFYNLQILGEFFIAKTENKKTADCQILQKTESLKKSLEIVYVKNWSRHLLP